MCRLSLVAVNKDYFLVAEHGLLIAAALLLQSMGSRVWGLQELQCVGSVTVALGLSCRAACGIFLGQESNLCPLHWQVDA